MRRIIDVFGSAQRDVAAEAGKQLVREHVVVVSYVIPVISFAPEGDNVVQSEDKALMIFKSCENIFESRLIPLMRENHVNDAIALPAVDVAEDYRKWVLDEVVIS